MNIQFASSLFTRIFGDGPLSMIINTAIIVGLVYYTWRRVFRPVSDTITRIVAFSRPRELGALEITPPKQSTIHPHNTQSLFAILQQQITSGSPVSFEIIGSKKKGITYRVIAERQDLPSIQKHFASYMTELRFNQVELSLEPRENVLVSSIRQSRHFAYPLKPHVGLEQSDPIAFIAGSMTRLRDEEEVTLQLVTRRYTSRRAQKIHSVLIAKGSVMIDGKLRYRVLAYAWIWLPAILVGGLTHQWQIGLVLALVLWLPSLFEERAERELTRLETTIYDNVAAKLEQPLLQTDIRLSVSSPDRAAALTNEFTASLETLNTKGFQRLELSRWPSPLSRQRYLGLLFSRRLGSILPYNSSVLSMSEIATLFHFPYGIIRTEGMMRTHSRVLPAPVSLHGHLDLDVIIGVNKYHGNETLIGLMIPERERHMYVVGGTGSGKTTLLKYQIIQDIRNGKGVAVIDPHGDFAEELLEYIPKEREKDLIYLNPDDLDHPIGINLLELPDGLTGNDLLREKDRVTESVISVMRKIFSEDDSGGHRIEYILRNATQTALTLEKPTLFTIFRLLNDGKFAKNAINNLTDEDLKAFWKNELGKAGSMQKVKMAAGITAKIGRFLFSASARAMLEQEKSTIDFSEILDSKILICNFSKGRLGEDTSMLFGITILAKLQLAALKRSEKKQDDRKPFYLYVDEFQNFATLSFTQMLSESRKYKVYLTMAEQSTQQQNDQKLVNIILANVGTIIVFRTGSPKDEELLLPLFEPYLEKGEISNLSAYNFYCRITGVDAQEPMSGETIVSH
ncbi:MAG: type IV secretion system DNA-binding domain-containing protein [Candidatus Saccharimonadales bacterium]